MPNEIRRRYVRYAGLGIFLLALATRIGLIVALGSYHNIERTEVVNVSIALMQKHGFVDAYGPGTGPTAHVAPVYPLLLSCIFRLFGTGTAGEIAQEIFSSAIASLTCALLPLFAIACGLSRSIGLWAGLCLALLPVNYWSETKGSFESALSALALMTICWYLVMVWRRRHFSFRQACAGGALAGVALLISPSILPVIVVALAAGIWLFREQLRAYVPYVCLFAAVTLLILMPWALRNKRVLGSLIFTRSNLGLELSISNSDFSHVDHEGNIADSRIQRLHPFLDANARAEWLRKGEVAFERDRKNQAIAWISSHPQRFLQLMAGRFLLFWFPHMIRTWQTILIRLEAAAGMIGFVLLWRTGHIAKWVFLSLWTSFPLVYYFVQAFARYRYPVDWSFVFLGAFAAHTLLTARRSHRLSSAPQAVPANYSQREMV